MGRKVFVVLLMLLLAGGTYLLLAPRDDGAGLDPGANPEAGGRAAELRAEGETRAATLEGRGAERSAAPQGEAPTAPDLPAPVDLEAVDRARDLHGRVVRADGTPVPGAVLTFVTYPWRTGVLASREHSRMIAEGPVTRSAVDGTFSLRLGRGRAGNLRVEKEGLTRILLPNVQAGQRLKVVMTEGVRLIVLVRDAAGKPAVDAHARLFRTGRRGDVTFRREGTTDAEGRCAFDSLPGGIDGTLELQHARLGNPGWLTVTLKEDGDTTFEVTLPAGRTLRGRVTDAVTGEAISGARVGMNWVADPYVLTDADGRYELHGWTGEGVRDVAVEAAGYPHTAERVDSREVVDFALPPGARLSGRVLGDGRPLAGVQVAGIASDRAGGIQTVSFDTTVTGEEGRFELDSLRRTMPHTIVLIAPGYGRTLLDVDLDPREVVTEVGDLELHAARTIAGVVRDSTGEPLARVRVDLRGANADRARLRAEGAGPAQTSYGGRAERFTDDLGRFVFPDLATGHYALTARPQGSRMISQDVALPEGHDVTDVVLDIVKGRAVRVRVLDATGEPRVGAYVSVSADEGSVGGSSVRTDAQGEGVLDVLADSATVRVFLARERETFLDVPPRRIGPADSEVEFHLERAGHAAGRLLDAEGKPLAYGEIIVELRGEDVATITADDTGSFRARFDPRQRVALVFAGRVRVVHPSGYTTRVVPLEGRLDGVRTGDEDLTLRTSAIPGDRRITVIVQKPDGSPLEGAYVVVSPACGSAPWLTDEDGRVEIEGLTERPILVSALPPPHPGTAWVAPPRRSVVPDGQEIVFRILAGVYVRGIVTRAEGAPAQGVRVHLFVDAEMQHAVVTDADGRYALPVDPNAAGRIRLEAVLSGPGTSLYRAVATDVDPKDGELTLKLAKVR